MKKNALVFQFVAILIPIMILSMIFAGCTQTQPPAPIQPKEEPLPPSKVSDLPPSPPQDQTQYQPGNSKQEILADNRSSYDKINQTILKAIEDGIYAKNASYNYHSGKVDFQIVLKLDDERITSLSLQPIQADNVSTNYIKKVNGALQELVVGKKISEISLPKQIAGSSLTTAAFQQYISELQATAK